MMNRQFSIYHSLGKIKEQVLHYAILRLFFLGTLAFFSLNANLNAQCQTCCNGSKPKSLVMIYNGKSCSESVTCQADGKWSCTGNGPNNAATVYIVVAEKSDGTGKIFFSGTVNLNGEFTVTAAAGGSTTFPSNIYFLIYSSQGGTLLQRVQNHTSCSTPLVAGDQMGATFIKTITLADNTVCNSSPPPPPGCNNVTCGGEIMDNETKCGPFDPAIITEAVEPCDADGDPLCFKIEGANSGSSNGVTYTVSADKKFLTVTGSQVYKVVVKGGPNSVVYTTPPFTNLSAPINPNTGQPYEISNFTICINNPPLPPATDCCNGSKPKSSVLRYTGQGCSASNTTQELGNKWNCTEFGGGPNGDPSVYITVSKNPDGSGGTYFAGTVNINENFTINSISGGSSTFPSNIYFNVYSSQGGTLLQRVQIHYSCSAPLVPGEQFGSLNLRSVTFADNTVCGEGASNGGGGGSGGQDCCDGSKPKSSTLLYNGQGCSSSNTSQPLGQKYNCSDIGGGPNGDPSVYIIASKNADGSGGTYFAGNVAINSTFTMTSIAGGSSTFPSNVYFNIYSAQGGTLLQKVQIHYSCSAPLVPGDQFGSLVLQSVTFADNTTCGIQPPPPPSGSDVEYKWLSSTTGCPTNLNQAIPGATGKTYDPPFISQTTWYVRLVRRVGCTADNEWLASNCVVKKVVNVNIAITNIVCDGKGTATTSDDTYTFVLNVTSTGGGTQWSAGFSNACLGAFAIGPTPYGTPVTLGPFPAGAGSCGNTFPPLQYQNGLNIDISVSDVDNPSCSKGTTVVSPGPCSPGATAGLGDFVWNDLNQNGQQDAGEPGIQGITVNLYTCGGTFLSTTTTNANGFYSFTNLTPNQQYFVEFTNLPALVQFSPKDATADNIDSDANTNTGRTDCTFLSPGEFDNTIDAGLFSATPQPASVGDFVWNDLDKDGVQDPGEPGVQGVLVKLFRCDNSFVGQFTTNVNGFYQFTNLAPGSYFVQFSNLPAGFQFTTKDAGADNLDSDADATTGNTACFNLVSGQYDPTRDAGIFQPTQTGPGSVGDYVWFDTDKDGVQDPGEPGVPGIFVILETCAGQFVNFAVTNAQGFYLITNVPAGNYRVKFASPGTINGSPVQFTVKDAGGDDTKDSDADNLGFTACFNLGAGQTNLTLDAGFVGQGQPEICVINGTLSNVVCNNGQTCFNLVVNGSNTGDWGYDIPALNKFMLNYGQVYNHCIPGSASPTTLTIIDHDVADCYDTVRVVSPPPCNGGGGTGNPCDAVTFTAGTNSITVSGLTAPIEIVKIFNAAWQTVYECTANCNNPTVANNLPAGTYFVKVQLFNASWQLTCTKEGYVTINNLNGGGGVQNLVIIPGSGLSTEQTPGTPGVSERTGGTVSTELAVPASLSIFPNPAMDFAVVQWTGVTEGQQAELVLFNQLGQAVQKVAIENVADGNYRLDLTGLESGQYVVRFRADAAAPVVKKLIISR